MNENEISYKVIGAALAVHSFLGPGLLESAYEIALAYELVEAGFEVRRQLPVPIVYKGIRMDGAYRVDLMVNEKVIIELKSVEFLAPVHDAQALTYLKLSGKKLGLLINFNGASLKAGINRIVNNL
ncbi:MAG TPA: GxxExxY protein [Cyclobacteriaceae bacterium]